MANEGAWDRAETVGLPAFAMAACVFLATSAPGLYWDDAGEIIAVALRGGVLHPPGHAVPALLFRAVAGVAGGEDAAARAVVLTCVLAGALAVGLWAQLVHRRWGGAPGVAVLAAVPLVGTHGALWRFSTTPEVYSLMALELVLLLWLIPVAGQTRGSIPERLDVLAGLVAALAALTHVILVPVGLAVALARIRGRRSAGNLLLGGGVGASVLLYLPLRSEVAEASVWGQSNHWQGLLDHLLAKDFQVEMFTQTYRATGDSSFLAGVAATGLLGPGGWALVGIGLISLLLPARWGGFVGGRRARCVLGAAVLSTGALALEFGGGFVLDAYLLPAHLMVMGVGVGVVGRWIGSVGRAGLRWGALGLLAVVGIGDGARAWAAHDQSGFSLARVYGEALAEACPPGALVVLDNSMDYFALEGYRAISGQRPDITVVYGPRLSRPWAARRLARILSIPEKAIADPDSLRAAVPPGHFAYLPAERWRWPAASLRPQGPLLVDSAVPSSVGSGGGLDSSGAWARFLAGASRSGDSVARRRAAVTLSRLAEQAARRGRPSEAAGSYERALDFEPENPLILRNLALVLRRAGRSREALIHLETWVRKGGGAVAWTQLGRARLEAGDPEGAVRALRTAREAGALGPAVETSLGLALLAAGEGPAAETHLTAAIAADPDQVSAWRAWVILLARAGRSAEAHSVWARAWALHPGHVELAELEAGIPAASGAEP